jgi:hypothetical protein
MMMQSVSAWIAKTLMAENDRKLKSVIIQTRNFSFIIEIFIFHITKVI